MEGLQTVNEIKNISQKRNLEEEIAALDNLYIQIKLHHERQDFEKAYQLFAEVSKRNERILELKEQSRLQTTT